MFKINFNRNTILITIAVVGIFITAVLIFADQKGGFSLPNLFGKSNQQIAEDAIKFINDNQLSNSPASLVNVSSESGIIKIRIKIGSAEFDSYATKDGKLLFPEAFKMVETAGDSSDNNSQPAEGKTAEEILAAIKKSDKPAVAAFIVSKCPFGLQMQRIIADAIKNVPSLAQYVNVKYIGGVTSDGRSITAMHGDDEAKENLRQICIRDEQPAKYWNYVSCYMKAGATTSCEAAAGISSSALNACVADPARGVAYAKKDFEVADSLNIGGSPTLVVNGLVTDEFDVNNKPVFGSARSSDEVRAVVCAAFSSEPAFCSTKLNTVRAAAGYSATYESTSGASGGDASCGS